MNAIATCAGAEEWRNVMEVFQGADLNPDLECNSGGPHSRSRELTICATVLGHSDCGRI